MLDYFMQSSRDPSLMYPIDAVIASQARKGGGKKSSLFEQVYLTAIGRLASAQKVSRFAPSSMERPQPRMLSPEEAYEFIMNEGALLRSGGFAVQIPNVKNLSSLPRITLKMKSKMKSSVKFNTASRRLSDILCEFDYRVALGGTELSAEEFRAMAASKAHLVCVRGKWMEFDPGLAERVAQLLVEGTARRTLPDVLAFVLRASEDGIETGVDIDGERYDSLLDAIGKKCCTTTKAPPEFHGALRPYQERGLGWLRFMLDLGFGALLADDMGLGKTVQVIAHVLNGMKNGQRPTLIVCPTSVIGNWAAEFTRFAPLIRVAIHHGGERETGDRFACVVAGADVIITSYALAWRDEQEIMSVDWVLVVADEAQNMKNPLAKQSKFLKGLSAKSRIALTGTPIENRLSDIWSIMEFLNPGYLAPWQRFKEIFAKPIEVEGDGQKKDALRKALSPFVLRRMKTDKSIIADLPEKTEKTEWCYLTPEQVTLYKAVVDDSLKAILDENMASGRRMRILATITKLKQICNHPSNYLKDSKTLGERSGKITRLRELLANALENGESCLVFSQYAEMASLLFENLSQELKAPVLFIHGGVERKQRERIIAEFQKAGGEHPKILVLSLKAGGVGLNLTRATTVIHFDRWWNPAVENQATDRAYRIGQTKMVFVYKFITKGTIEERIEEILEGKKELADSIIGAGETILADLNTEKLREFFDLRE